MDITNEIIFSVSANDDLEDIYLYVSETLKAIKAADNFLYKLSNNIMRLEEMPESCSLYKNSIYRKLIINNYMAIYYYDKKNKIVSILRIVYFRRSFFKI